MNATEPNMAACDSDSPPGGGASLGVDEILAAFDEGALKPVRVSLFYRLGLLAVAVAMILLPLVYLGLIGLCGWVVFYHATEHTDLLSRGGFGALFAYLAPLTVGLIAILFMIKPLFARRPEPEDTLILNDDEEPVLRAFVSRICQLVNAPEPREIEINCEVNAAASFRRGWLSLTGQDLKLIIGLPLAAGMSLRSFGGVLAHEFGHFAQGAGMRLTFVIRNINAWFSRVVYERDQWDLWLESTAKSIDLRIGAALYLAMLLVWLTRRILWVLMWLGHFLSCFALRHMEYDADTWEARFAGSDHFAETSERLQILGLGQSRALELLRETWKEKQLAENLPDLVQAETDDLPAEVKSRFHEGIAQSKTGLLDTHPADSDRIAAAIKLDAPGVFRLEAPATVLFADWRKIAGRATRLFYRHAIGEGVEDENIIANERLRSAGHTAAYQACERFFLGRLSISRPLFLDRDEIAGDPRGRDELQAALKEAREAMLTEEEKTLKDVAQFDEADERRFETLQAQVLLQAGRRASARIRGLSQVTRESAFHAMEEIAATMRDARKALADFDNLAKARMTAALALACGNPANRSESGGTLRLLAALDAIRHVYPQLLQMRDGLAGMNALFEDLRDENEDAFIDALQNRAAELGQQLKEVRRLLGEAPYPFDHANGDISMARFAGIEVPSDMDPVFRRFAEAEACVERLLNLYLRIIGSLAMIAEKEEAADPAGV